MNTTLEQSILLANKLVNHILLTNTFTYFSPNIGEKRLNMSWLPAILKNHIAKFDLEKYEIVLNFKIKPKKSLYRLELEIFLFDGSEDEDNNLHLVVSREEFVKYLSLAIYHNGDESGFVLSDGDDRCFTLDDLLNGTDKTKFFFPKW